MTNDSKGFNVRRLGFYPPLNKKVEIAPTTHIKLELIQRGPGQKRQPHVDWATVALTVS